MPQLTADATAGLDSFHTAGMCCPWSHLNNYSQLSASTDLNPAWLSKQPPGAHKAAEKGAPRAMGLSTGLYVNPQNSCTKTKLQRCTFLNWVCGKTRRLLKPSVKIFFLFDWKEVFDIEN